MDARNIYLAGEFNEWNLNLIPMRPLNNNGFVKKLTSEKDLSDQCKYCFDHMDCVKK